MRRAKSGCLTAQAKAKGPPKSCAIRFIGGLTPANSRICATNSAMPSSVGLNPFGTSERPKPGKIRRPRRRQSPLREPAISSHSHRCRNCREASAPAAPLPHSVTAMSAPATRTLRLVFEQVRRLPSALPQIPLRRSIHRASTLPDKRRSPARLAAWRARPADRPESAGRWRSTAG